MDVDEKDFYIGSVEEAVLLGGIILLIYCIIL